jgi:uncharacterized protein DUF4175
MDHRAELVDVIRRVRNRWRLRLALRGAVIVCAGTIAALLLSASSLEGLRFTPGAIVFFRILAVTVFALLAARWFVRPLMRRVTDTQVALYLEECDPTLETALLSAIEASAAETGAHSPRLLERLVEEAIAKCRAVDHARTIERAASRRHLVTLASVAAGAALLVALGPAFLRHGMSALLILSRSAEAASPYRIDVRPGNAKVPRGSDQMVNARLVGFASSDVSLMVHTAPGAPFERVPLVATSDPSAFEGMLFHLEQATDYFVESNGVRSATFSMAVLDLPTVKQLELEYRFPAYTGLPPQKVETAGDVAALRGTEVRVRVVPSIASRAGRILLNDAGASALTPQADGSLTGSFTIDKQGFYRIELNGPQDEKVDASPQYTIDALDDQPPSVSFVKPGRDTGASPVEEVFLQAKADDDFGVKQLQLTYTVNGGHAKTITLFGGARSQQDVTGSHTLYLEELGLTPGDFVSYYAKATDNSTVHGPNVGTSDIYFVQIKPFNKDYKRAQSQAQQGGGQQNGVGQLSEQQRQIVAATFNVVRDKAKLKADKFRENVVFLNLAQGKLREQVDELVGKMNSRIADDAAFKKIAEALPKAAQEMRAAESQLKTLKADDALLPEQRALKLLQDAEQEYETQVAMQQGGGGGGGQSAMAEDLADLFDLELDKLANQYEMQKRAEQQSGDREIDALVEKLKDLARRQQQEAERQRRMAAAGQSPSGGGTSAAQRALAEEAKEAARRLEQLTRDEQRQDLSDAARRMQEAADAMRQAAANGSKDGGAQANAALDRLRDAQQRLERNQSGRPERDLQQAQRSAQELAGEQKDVAAQVQALEQAGAARQSRAQALGQRKDAMDAKLGDLQQQLEKLGNQTRKDDRDASQKLDDAAGSIRDKRIREKIRYSKGTLNGQPSEYARAMEDDIAANLDALQKKIGDAAGAMGQAKRQDAMARAAEKARDLVRGMESLNQRTRDRARNGAQPAQGARGSQGSPGSQRADGSQGAQGSPGDRGSDASPGTPGSQAAEGAQGAQGAQGSPDAQGSASPSSRPPNAGQPPGMTGDAIRQYRRELREWQGDAQALRQQLQAAGINPRDLDQVLRDLHPLDNDRAYADLKGLQALQAEAIDHLKRFEFSLRKRAESEHESLSLSGSDEVPAGFRQAIEEYYRSLAKKQPK